MIAGVFKLAWSTLVGHKIALAFYGGLAACVVVAGVGVYQWGRNVAEGECTAAALRAELAAVKADRDAANDRAARAALIVAALNERRYATEQEIQRLQDDLAKTKLQSTQPGATHDPNAILDDQCNYTRRGVSRRRLRR